MRRYLAGGLLLAAFLGAGTSCEGLESSVYPCTKNSDCVFPYACCGGQCAPIGQECRSSAILVPGNPCRRLRPSATEVTEPYFGECDTGATCCVSTLTCVAFDPNSNGSTDPCPPIYPEVDGGDLPCTADHECPTGAICCGIDIFRRNGKCTSVAACGGVSGTPTPPIGGAGGAAGGAGSGGCEEPKPAPTGTPCDSIPPQPEPGLVAYWPIANEPGVVACDLSGNGHHGELEGGASLAGEGRTPGASSLSITDGDGGLRVHAGSDFDFSPATSVSFWLNADSLGAGSILVARGATAGNLFNLSVTPERALELFARSAEGVNSDEKSPDSLFPLATWTHLAVVIEASGLQRFYRNGTQIHASQSAVAARTFCSDLVIGKGVMGAGQLLGRLDDIKWWNLALTPDKICQEAGGTLDGQNCQVPPATP